jgi:Capsule polysaccharide export protein
LKNVVLLQGPLGPFFSRLADCFLKKGIQAHRIHFNGGDAFYSHSGQRINYTGTPEEWRTFLTSYIIKHQIDTLFCYGDCRFYHKIAREICQQYQLSIWIFEEGYLRPDFITLEKEGTNANSAWFDNREHFAVLPKQPRQVAAIGSTFLARAIYATCYYNAMLFRQRQFPHYLHHRSHSVPGEAWAWIKSGWIKLTSQRRDKRLVENLQAHAGNLFLVPLQVADDFQVREHSPYNSIGDFIEELILSFAKHAEPQQLLLFKHHPMDRGHVNYQALITKVSTQAGVIDRVFYGHELPLPTLYPLCRGVITINSTVGLSALRRNVPTLTLGEALYDIPDVTSQCSLDDFWKAPSPVDAEKVSQLRHFLLNTNQLNCSFYRTDARTFDQIWSWLQHHG